MTMCSVVIPAHNEEVVIGRCLDALLDGVPAGAMEIVVACNGCTDRTAEIARAYGEPVKVVEPVTASKAAALNLGEQAVSAFPRFYVDADVVLRWAGVRTIVEAMESSGAMAAAPVAKTQFDNASCLVRAFYGVWTRTAYFQAGMIGCGVYALSKAGRARFDRFPEIIADDGFIRSRFTGSQRISVPEAAVAVFGPRTWSALIKAKTRSRLGRYELNRQFADQVHAEQDEKDYRGTVMALVRSPRCWACLPIYLLVNFVARYRAQRQFRQLDKYAWERDESSRQAALQ